ncbi:hypothetical protein VTL71DRAFT_15881 [Oculimacula yallundae]|uniref:Uncharacterized protein n=1 Tax=Oculimacula yallundae TaxID=86028 RepID=A0ABR4CCX6_9HELO
MVVLPPSQDCGVLLLTSTKTMMKRSLVGMDKTMKVMSKDLPLATSQSNLSLWLHGAVMPNPPAMGWWDKSVYWTPALYSLGDDGEYTLLEQIGGRQAFQFWFFLLQRFYHSFRADHWDSWVLLKKRG